MQPKKASPRLDKMAPSPLTRALRRGRITLRDGRSGFLREQPGAVAVLRFTAAHYAIRNIIDPRRGGPWKVPGHLIPELNKHLKGAIVVIAPCGQAT